MINFKQPYNRTDFLNFLWDDLLPEDFVKCEDEISFEAEYTRKVTFLGNSESLELAVFEVLHNSKHDARVSLSKEAFRLLLRNSTKNKALILFVPLDNPNTYRFSLVTIDVEIDENKVRKSYSNPRRYSFKLGTDAMVETPKRYLAGEKGRIKDEKDLKGRFSVEALTKEFYRELSDWYFWAIDHVHFPSEPENGDPDKLAEHKSKNVIRLLTRLLFVWFLKQKRLIPDEFFNEEYVEKNLLKGFNPNQKQGLGFYKALDSKYYKAILQNLFFAMLNCPITPQSKEDTRERGFRKKDNWGQHRDANFLMRYEELFKDPKLFLSLANSTIPFLNGGLFDCLDEKSAQPPVYIDGFSDNLVKPHKLIVPDFLFFGENEGKGVDLSGPYGDKKKKSVNIKGLIDILSTYNFTIVENTPIDQEVSLDPELLGKVFENLLASYNPETKSTARKQTGSFYTPREIVQYMVDESLIAYLKNEVGEELEPEYRKLMKYTDDEIYLSQSQKEEIIKALFSCKIIDPACGSGAFPVGILQQMVHVLRNIDQDNRNWESLILEEAAKDSQDALQDKEDNKEDLLAEIGRAFNQSINRPDYARKLYLIENCIYGVDIQAIAVQISKLRFFISLVVEQKANSNAEDNFGIRPLPNLEAKFVAANTLIGIEKKEATLFDSPEIKAKEKELKSIRHKIFSAKNPAIKRNLKESDKLLRNELAELLSKNKLMDDFNARILANWDPYDQNASSPFFDPEWMFGITDGFDIVIGNPPYLRIQGIRDMDSLFADQLVKQYKSATGSFDLYAVFTEKGLNIINYNGIVNFIMPVKWTNAAFGKGLRLLISKEQAASKIINFGAYQVFNASTYTGIQWFKRKCENLDYLELDRNLETNQDLEIFLSSLTDKSFVKIPTSKLGCESWVLTMGRTTAILNKLNEHSRRISDVFNKIFQGLATSKDDVYFLYKCKKQSDTVIGYSKYLGREVEIELGLAKPLLKGEDVHRYDHIKTDKYVVFPYNLENGKANLFNEVELSSIYPSAYSYLKECEDVLRGREKDRFNIDGAWFQFGRKQGIIFAETEKLVSPDISLGGNFAYDSKGEFYHTTTIYGYIKKSNVRESYKCFQSIFNSKLCWWFLVNTGTTLANGYFRFKPDYINPFPIPEEIPINTENAIVEIVDKIMTNKKTNPNADNALLENQIDRIVYELYGITNDEIKIIESK